MHFLNRLVNIKGGLEIGKHASKLYSSLYNISGTESRIERHFMEEAFPFMIIYLKIMNCQSFACFKLI